LLLGLVGCGLWHRRHPPDEQRHVHALLGDHLELQPVDPTRADRRSVRSARREGRRRRVDDPRARMCTRRLVVRVRPGARPVTQDVHARRRWCCVPTRSAQQASRRHRLDADMCIMHVLRELDVLRRRRDVLFGLDVQYAARRPRAAPPNRPRRLRSLSSNRAPFAALDGARPIQRRPL